MWAESDRMHATETGMHVLRGVSMYARTLLSEGVAGT